MKRILVTAGATQTDIDKVRAITNIFKGRTGGLIALEAGRRGHDVTLLCSELSLEFAQPGIRQLQYRTFDELRDLMAREISAGSYDAVIHSAAVSDYKPVRVTTDPNGTDVEGSGAKIGSYHDSLWIELRPTEKIIALIRKDWDFKGVLVMFKLEVEKTDAELVDIVRPKMAKYGCDLAVANCLEWSRERALFVTADRVTSMARNFLAAELIDRLES